MAHGTYAKSVLKSFKLFENGQFRCFVNLTSGDCGVYLVVACIDDRLFSENIREREIGVDLGRFLYFMVCLDFLFAFGTDKAQVDCKF